MKYYQVLRIMITPFCAFYLDVTLSMKSCCSIVFVNFNLVLKIEAYCNRFSIVVHFLLQAIYINRINEGGAAAKDGKLAVGDRVISVSTGEDEGY